MNRARHIYASSLRPLEKLVRPVQMVKRIEVMLTTSARVGLLNQLSVSNARFFQNDIYHREYSSEIKDEDDKAIKKTPIYRICLTGGPCSGKTTALASLKNVIESKGFIVFNVPEAATLLMKGGAMINVEKLNEDQMFKFQIELMKTQIALEDTFKTLAENSGMPAVIICDRGLMDTRGYTGQEVFDRILDHTGWSTIELRDNRYDGILHLVTAADGAAEFYDHENEARFETAEEAVHRDLELRKAYIGHNKLFVIDNRSSFQQKIEATVKTVLSIIGMPTRKTRHRKFLVDTRGLDFCAPEDDQCRIKPSYVDFHAKLFESTGVKPKNTETVVEHDDGHVDF